EEMAREAHFGIDRADGLARARVEIEVALHAVEVDAQLARVLRDVDLERARAARARRDRVVGPAAERERGPGAGGEDARLERELERLQQLVGALGLALALPGDLDVQPAVLQRVL